MGLFSNYFSYDDWFFAKFEEQAENLKSTSDILLQITQGKIIDPLWATFLSESEKRGDRLAKELIQKAQSTFVTPFDREDIYELAHTVDDVLDYIEEAVVRIVAYGIIGDKEINMFFGIVRESLQWLYNGILQLKTITSGRIYEITEKIIECEHQADKLVREIISESYNLNITAILGSTGAAMLTAVDLQRVIDFYNYKRKRREIAEILEKACDACRHVFHTLGNIKLKNG